MKRALIVIICIIAWVIFTAYGCTKIENPTRETDDEGGNDLQIIPSKSTILDTEPVILIAEGGKGTISWKTKPLFESSFQPETGSKVLFIPPDIEATLTLTISAEDEKKHLAEISLKIIDEGIPPQPGDILINEIAWAGTLKSAYDEYIEIINKTKRPFYLNNWSIENAAGSGSPLGFSGRVEPESIFLIANYPQGNDSTAISCGIHFTSSSLSLPNNSFGPFILKDAYGTQFDAVGDGGGYLFGLNSRDRKASMARFSYSNSTTWNVDSWYTESVSLNLSDGTLGTPSAPNSDIPLGPVVDENDARAIITEFAINANDEIGEDWVELFITKSGLLNNFIITDLDGEDLPIIDGADLSGNEGEYFIVVWGDARAIFENKIYITDTNPTATKDELVILCGDFFLDGLCYYSTENAQFDDGIKIQEYGWIGDPVKGLHGSRKKDVNGKYLNELTASSWDEGALKTPGF
ncbi:MAG: hypothetical protein ACUVWJ_00400 [Spirochaetota bacterium]